MHKLVIKSKTTSCALDPTLTKLVKEYTEELSPLLTYIINRCTASGKFPHEWKTALVVTLLKKAGIDLIPKNYRAMSNLQCVSKLTEPVVVNELCLHSVCGFPLLSCQSAYRAGHCHLVSLLTEQGIATLSVCLQSRALPPCQSAYRAGHCRLVSLHTEQGIATLSVCLQSRALPPCQSAYRAGHCHLVSLLTEQGIAALSVCLQSRALPPCQSADRAGHCHLVSLLTEQGIATLSVCLQSRALPPCQSAYRVGHSTETDLVKIQSDILLNMDQQKVTQLVLIVLSSAFGTVDYDILLNIMNCTFGVSATALNWFSSCLQSRSQRVIISGMVSDQTDLDQGVLRGSCIGPAEFKEYSSLAFMSLISTGNWGMLTLMTIKYTTVSTLILWMVSMSLWNGASVIPAAGREALNNSQNAPTHILTSGAV